MKNVMFPIAHLAGDIMIGERDEKYVYAQLVGGPNDLLASARLQRVLQGLGKIKVRYHGGYEHFEPEPESDPDPDPDPDPDRDPGKAVAEPGHVVYRWTGRTKIAE
jgi:hypothetical protein